MNEQECQRLHLSLDTIGMRARGTSVGLLQLCKELLNAGVLDHDAVIRIREAIVADIALNCPRTVQRAEYQQMVRDRLDSVLNQPTPAPARKEADATLAH